MVQLKRFSDLTIGDYFITPQTGILWHRVRPPVLYPFGSPEEYRKYAWISRVDHNAADGEAMPAGSGSSWLVLPVEMPPC